MLYFKTLAHKRSISGAHKADREQASKGAIQWKAISGANRTDMAKINVPKNTSNGLTQRSKRKN